MAVDPGLLDHLICPLHGMGLREEGSTLVCESGHVYPVFEDIPVILHKGPQTLWVAESSLKQALGADADEGDPYCIATLGISGSERALLRERLREAAGGIDPVAAFMIGATNGVAYRHLIGRLTAYPIPQLRLPPGDGRVLLDIGCNWGRWCIAAARCGYAPIGIDPSLGAVLAARRIARQSGLNIGFVVGDARFLPFRRASIDTVFSYSVLQHFSREDASAAIREIGRVLKPKGTSLIQMPNTFGVRCLYHQARRRFREATGFEVRYWSVPALRRIFTSHIGRTVFSVDCFFGLGLQASDLPMMPWKPAMAIRISEILRMMSRSVPWLRYLADSVYVESYAD